MTNTKFTIRYYADKFSAQEYRLKDTGAEFFPEGIAYSIWDRKGLFSDGVFSVHYLNGAYILSSLVALTPDTGNVDDRLLISVALMRGYELSHPLEVFDKLFSEFKNLVSTYGEDIAQALFYNTSKIYGVVSGYIVQNQDQPVYDCASNVRAVTAYGRKEEVESLMSHPSRPEFEGFSELIVLPQPQAVKCWPELHQMGFASVTNIEYPYRRTYKLRYPDGSVETIDGLEQEVDHTCRQPHGAPLSFKGRLREHVEDWQITLNPGKTEYIIGRDFEWEYKSYTIDSKDEHGNACEGVVYASSVGVVKGNRLILRGPEIDKAPKLALRDNYQWKLIAQVISEADSKIVVTLAKINLYDVSPLWRDVRKKLGENQSIAITLVNTKKNEEVCTFHKTGLALYHDLPYTQAAYKIDDGGKHEICYVPLMSDGTPGSYELKEKSLESKPSSDKKNRNWRKRYRFAAAICVVLTCVLLFRGGGQDSKGQDAQLQALVDSLEYRVEELQVSNNNLIGENKALHESIAKLQEPSKTEEQPQSIGRERKDARREREKDKEEREALVAKLRGTSFTQEDINKLEGMGSLTEEERELLTSCRNCFRFLNVATNTKDKNDKQHAAEQIKNRKGWLYENLYRVLIEEHKAVMENIIIGEYASVYKTDRTQYYKSIKDAIDNYNEW